MAGIGFAVVAVGALLVVGNVAIALTSAIVRRVRPNDPLPPTRGVRHLHPVDHRVWRSSAPSTDAYRSLAERGASTVIDLRAERHLRDDKVLLADTGVELLRLPIRDGQTPTRVQVQRALETIRASDGITLIHCGAGVGRTGCLVGAYLVSTGTASRREAVRRNLAVGPPSLEQIWYVARLDEDLSQPNIVVKVVSRVLDAPRRIWSRIRHLRR